MCAFQIRTRSPHGEAGPLRITRDPDVLASVLEDAAHFPGGHAAGIVSPANEAEVAAVLRGATAVLPIGAQSLAPSIICQARRSVPSDRRQC